MHDNRAASAEEEAAVRAAYQRFMDGWKQGSGAAYAAALRRTATWSGSTGSTSEGALRSPRFTRSYSTSGSKGAGSWERSRVCGS
jgi:hypothetical protein